MFNVDQAIANWRRRMASGGVKNPALLDELESHLRGDMRVLVAAGTPESQAFQLAVSRLGQAGPLRAEFHKLEEARCWPVTIVSWLFVAGIVGLAGWLLTRLLAGKLSLLLGTHVFTVAAGYGAAFFAGGLGIYCVCNRLFRGAASRRQASLDRAVRVFSPLAAGLVIAGFGLGALWAHQHFGKYLIGDAKEVGALCVILWFVALPVMQRRGRLSERVTMLICIGGNVIVGLAWFGAAILVDGPKMHDGPASYLPLALSIFLGIHVVFLLMGLAPAPEVAES
jgi:hypothetical protein